MTRPAPDADGYLPLKALSQYSGIGLRRLRDYLHDPVRPLPHYRIGGKVLVRRSDFDAWAARFRVADQGRVDALVADVLKGV